MAATLSDAPEVRAIAQLLIPEFHPHLEGIRIEYLFTDTTPSRNGKAIWGQLKKISGLNAYLAYQGEIEEDEKTPSFFVMTISKEVWTQLDDNCKVALVDHELCHGGVDEEGAPVMISHDLEEFEAVVKRRGLWRPEIKLMSEAMDSAKSGKKKLISVPAGSIS